MPTNALVLGGGAPNFTLMTGALLAFEEAGVRFDVVTGAGGGGAVALTYVAPKGFNRIDALKNSVNYGISDAIYKWVPMNYKMFQKGSKVADLYRGLLKKIPGYNLVLNQYAMNDRQKLVSDLIQAAWAITTPSTVNFFSKGLCAHAPFIELMVDFDKLKEAEEAVYISSYCVTDHEMVVFDKSQINMETFGASLSYPFLYPPTNIKGKNYLEGATNNAFNFAGVIEYALEHHERIDNIVCFDSFGFEGYLTVPPNLWQAWGQSLITPLIPLDQANLAMFKDRLTEWNTENPDKSARLLPLEFDIPAGWSPTALDWSRSNLNRLFNLGYEEGKKFLERYKPVLDGTGPEYIAPDPVEEYKKGVDAKRATGKTTSRKKAS